MNKLTSGLVGATVGALAMWFVAMFSSSNQSTQSGAVNQVNPASSNAAELRRPGVGGPTLVTTHSVEYLAYTNTFSSVGIAKARANVKVRNEVAGTVTQVHFGANQQVSAGDPLISMDARVEQIALASAKISLDETRADLLRLQTLQKNNSGAVSEVEVIEAENLVAQAQTMLEKAEYDLAQKTVRAPFSGTLGLSDVEQGEFLANATDIVSIIDTSYFSIEFGLPDRAARSLAQGQTVRLVTNSLAGQVVEGKIEGFDPLVDPTTQTIKVRASVANQAGRILPGMVFNVTLTEQNQPLPRVPATAVTWSRNGAAVWVVENSITHRRSVEIRHRDRDMVWVEGNINNGDHVVVEGVQKVRENGAVSTTNSRFQANGDQS